MFWNIISLTDRNFSPVLFRDFAYTLFSKVHEARGNQNLDRFGQFLNSDARNDLANLSPGVTDVSGVIVGSLRVERMDMTDDRYQAWLVYEANYTEHFKEGTAGVYTSQVWGLERNLDVQSDTPDNITAFECLACGSAFEPTLEGNCNHCGELVQPGEYHWTITSVTEKSRASVGPALTTSVPDVGLHIPTVRDPNYYQEKDRFKTEHPGFDFRAMTYRFRHIFFELQEAWSQQDLERLRPFETDNLFQNHSYWVREYQKQGLRNELGQIRVNKLEVVKIQSDPFYDAVTCRIFASMTDCTRWNNGFIACGSPAIPKHFSEYWTFIRGRGAPENTHNDANCPNCGAVLKINMAGECEFCDSKLTSGQFDWVLSEIQQDEKYGG